MATDVAPYHEVIARVIAMAKREGFGTLALIVRQVQIPVGHHDEVIAAWEGLTQRHGFSQDIHGVWSSLLAQKQEAEAVKVAEDGGLLDLPRRHEP